MCSRWRCGWPKNNLYFFYACASCQETNCRNTENTCNLLDDKKTSVIMDNTR